MRLRLRFPELLEERGMSAYALAQKAGIATSVAYRLVEQRGEFEHFKADLLGRLCVALDVTPGELFAPSSRKRRK